MIMLIIIMIFNNDLQHELVEQWVENAKMK